MPPNDSPQPLPTAMRPHPNRWHRWLIVLAVANLLLLVIPLVLMVCISLAATPGVEFLGLLVAPVLAIGSILPLVNVIVIPLYIKKQRPTGKAKRVSIAAIAASCLLLAWGVYSSFHNFQIDKPLTRQEAVKLIQDCKVLSLTGGGNGYDITLRQKSGGEDDFGLYRRGNQADYDAVFQAARDADARCSIEITP